MNNTENLPHLLVLTIELTITMLGSLLIYSGIVDLVLVPLVIWQGYFEISQVHFGLSGLPLM